jgi:hypothetical protein
MKKAGRTESQVPVMAGSDPFEFNRLESVLELIDKYIHPNKHIQCSAGRVSVLVFNSYIAFYRIERNLMKLGSTMTSKDRMSMYNVTYDIGHEIADYIESTTDLKKEEAQLGKDKTSAIAAEILTQHHKRVIKLLAFLARFKKYEKFVKPSAKDQKSKAK